jgi:arylsulfatase A-like enzyme
MRWLAAVATTALFFGSSPLHAADRLPNVVLVFADDFGYGDVGCYGAKGWTTPNLDRMAKGGTRFTSFYVAQAVCSASRCALLTGCYPNRLGILGALNPNSKHGIHDREVTLGELFKSRGYATAIFGKWHLGHHPQFLPTRHGFGEYFGLPYSNDMLPRQQNNFTELPLIDGDKAIKLNPDQSQLTTQYTERAVRFIEKNKDRPFFLYVPHTMSHVPLGVSDKFKGKSEQGLYGDVMMEIDWSVGQILTTLEKHKLDQNTLVIFTTDNGPWLSYGNHAGGAGGLREGKGTTFEGGVRVPCIARWPGKVPAGHVCDEPAMTIDLFPTLARLIGAELPKHPIDGLDIGPLLFGQPGAKCPHEAFYFYWGNELQAIRSGKWKLHFPHEYRALTGTPGKDGRAGGYTNQRTELALFDLEKDSGEKFNVADRHPDVVERLKALAEKAREELGDSGQRKTGKGFRAPATIEAKPEEKKPTR